MDVSRYFYNSKYISAGPESNKYKAWWVSQMYGRLSLPAESSHPSDRGHLMRAPCTFLTCANPSQSSALRRLLWTVNCALCTVHCAGYCAGLFTRTRMRDEMTRWGLLRKKPATSTLTRNQNWLSASSLLIAWESRLHSRHRNRPHICVHRSER